MMIGFFHWLLAALIFHLLPQARPVFFKKWEFYLSKALWICIGGAISCFLNLLLSFLTFKFYDI